MWNCIPAENTKGFAEVQEKTVMKRLAGMITTWLIKQGAIGECDRELYEYAAHSFFLAIAPFVYAIMIGSLMGERWISLVLVLPFAIIRKYSGGFHAKREWTCLVSSCLLLSGCILAASRMNNSVSFGGLVLLGVIWLIRFSPIDTENRRLEPDEKKLRKREAGILSSFFYLMYLVLSLFGQERYAVCVGVGILQTAGLQIPCILQKMTEKFKNRSFHSKGVEK